MKVAEPSVRAGSPRSSSDLELIFAGDRRQPIPSLFFPQDWSWTLAKKMDREYVWLQCTETGDLNYRTQIRVKGGIDEKVKEGFKKFCPRLRKHTLHKIKRK